MTFVYRPPHYYVNRKSALPFMGLPKELVVSSDGGVGFGGSVAPKKVAAKYCDGGIFFDGAITPTISITALVSGGVGFGGVAPSSTAHIRTAAGLTVFGGSAPFSRTYNFVPGKPWVGFGGSAKAKHSDDYAIQWHTGGPGFKVNDLLIARRTDYDATAQRTVTYEVIAEVVEAEIEAEAKIHVIEGKDYLPRFGTDLEFTRFGNTADTKRQGSIFITSDDLFTKNNFDDLGKAPYIDIRDGVDSYAQMTMSGDMFAHNLSGTNTGDNVWGTTSTGKTVATGKTVKLTLDGVEYELMRAD